MLKARVFSLCFQLFIWIPDLSDKFCKLNKYKTQISILSFIENKENYFAMIGSVIDSCSASIVLNRVLFNSKVIDNETFRQNADRIYTAKKIAITTHEHWVIDFLEKSPTQHNIKSLVSSVYVDLFNSDNCIDFNNQM